MKRKFTIKASKQAAYHRMIRTSTESIGNEVFTTSDGDEFKLDDMIGYAMDCVNDRDYNWELNTPELFSNAVVNFIEDEYGISLDDKERDYVIEESSTGDFELF